MWAGVFPAYHGYARERRPFAPPRENGSRFTYRIQPLKHRLIPPGTRQLRSRRGGRILPRTIIVTTCSRPDSADSRKHRILSTLSIVPASGATSGPLLELSHAIPG